MIVISANSDLCFECLLLCESLQVMGWAYARGEHITKEHLLVYWLGPVKATLLAVWFFKVVFKPLTEEQEKPKAKSE